jgi:hypothetical protein
VPTGVITIQRFQLPKNFFPQWSASRKTLCELHLTTGKKIEDIPNTLQVYTYITLSIGFIINTFFTRLILPINIL